MIKLTGGIGSFTITWDPINIPDVLGYVICGVPGTDDFAVSGSNILNVGPESSFTYYTTIEGSWAVKVGAYDTFSNPKALILSDLNFSSLQSVEVKGLTSEVLNALTGELTEDHLYQALNDRLDLIDDPTGGLVPKVSSLEGQYTVKMNAGTTHAIGFGLASDVDGSGTSEFMVLADKFKIVHPTLPDQAKQIFTVGSINGTSGQVGINGALLIDGSLQVSQNVAVGGTLSIGGATVSFAAPTPSGIGAIETSLTNAPAGILNSNVTPTSISAVATDLSNAPATILNSNITPTSISAVATDLTNAPSGILNSNVTATSIGAVKTDASNAPAGILNSNISIGANGALSGAGGGSVTLTGLGYTIPTYDLIGGTKPPTDADKTSTILGDTGTLTLNAALTINSLLTISGSAAGITSGLASYSSDGTGFWISKDTSNSRMRVGTVSAGVLTNGFVWDGTAFKVRGTLNADDMTAGTLNVDNLVAPNSIINPESAYTPDTLTVTTEADLQSVTIVATGKPILLTVSFQQLSGTSAQLNIKRTTAGVTTTLLGPNSQDGTHAGFVSFSIMDSPAAGTHIYSVTGTNISVQYRSLVAIELKTSSLS